MTSGTEATARGFGFSASLAALVLSALPAVAQEHVVLASADDLSQLTIEQLTNLEVMSVSRRPEAVGQAPAAIYVITGDEIERVGARSLPEALRLAPNLQVARIDTSSYAITARGFNSAAGTANKLQVLIDGRSVYTPFFSGVFWDAQNVLLEDVDRIEVISGPAGTLWGANAVNGVINIVTHSAHETQGTFARAGAGSHNTLLELRHGWRLRPDSALRIYGMGFQRGPSERTNNAGETLDEWEHAQGGFRFDWTGASDTVTIQGDAYYGEQEPIPGQLRDSTISGGNVLGRWTRQLDEDARLHAQLYYDRARRTLVSGIAAVVDTVELDGQYDVRLGAHSLVVGAGVRINEDEFTPGPGTASTDPARRTLRLGHGFVQDTLAISPNVDLTLGLKLEHNSFTGLEYMPSARIAWRLSEDEFVWAAVSRAVRTPSRFETDLRSPIIAGGPNFHSEELIAYEAGVRMRPTDSSRLSATVYVHDYDELRTLEADPVTTFPLTIQNRMRGQTAGLELWADYLPTDWWRITAGLNLLHKDLELEPGSLDVQGVNFVGNDPDYQVTLRSSMDLGSRTMLDVSVRAVDDLPEPHVASYVAVDARLAWRMTDDVEIALSGYNLFDETHAEFTNTSVGTRESPRSVLLSASWRF